MRPPRPGSASPAGASSAYSRIWAVVRRIPRGKVATYGQIAVLAGLPGRARQVGYALHALPEGSNLPWQRVVNARGEVSPRAEPGRDGYQRHLLEEEGVRFGGGRIDLDRFGWEPAAPRPRKRRADEGEDAGAATAPRARRGGASRPAPARPPSPRRPKP